MIIVSCYSTKYKCYLRFEFDEQKEAFKMFNTLMRDKEDKEVKITFKEENEK